MLVIQNIDIRFFSFETDSKLIEHGLYDKEDMGVYSYNVGLVNKVLGIYPHNITALTLGRKAIFLCVGVLKVMRDVICICQC